MIIGFDDQVFGLQALGGISRYFVALGDELQVRGETVVCAPGLHVNAWLEQARFEVSGRRVRRYPRALANKIRALNAWHSDRHLRRRGAEILHQTYYRASAHRAGPIPLVVTVHDLIHELFPEECSPRDPLAASRRAAVARADHVICISRATQRDLVERLAVPRSKTSVIHHGFTRLPVDSGQGASSAGAGEGRPYLLHVGNRQGYKNFMGLLGAYAASPSLRGAVRLVAFGGGPPRTEELEAIRRAGLSASGGEPDVGFLGGDDARLGRCLRGALALVAPSRYEGFGLPPLEAMDAGCPVVSSRASVMPEILGTAPHYFDPGEPEDIRRALEEVVSSDTLRARLIQGGRLQAARYSWSRCAEETLAVYRRLLSQVTPASAGPAGRA